MEKLSMCRLCLASDVRLRSLARHLQDVYEKLTAMTFKREDNRPLVACYICLARLRNCYQLRKSCLQSEELLTQMQYSGVSLPQVSRTNTFRVVSVLNLSLGHVQQNSIKCHIKEESPEIIYDAELDQEITEDIEMAVQEEHGVPIDDDLQCSHLEGPLDLVKRERDDVETGIKIEYDIPTDDDLQYSHLEIEMEPDSVEAVAEENIIQAESNGEPGVAGPTSLSAENICPKILNVAVKRMVPNDTRIGSEIKKLAEIDPLLYMEPENVYKNKKVRLKAHLECHTRAHNKDKPFQCGVCNKCYSSDYYFTQHMYTHTGGYPYFASKYSRHSDKPYKCDVCKKCFNRKVHLKTHSRTHTDEKPYICDVCKKCFKQKSNLTSHVRIHTGEKPYMCDICKKCFTEKTNLISHVRTHTGDKPYICVVCKNGFTQKAALERHSRTHNRTDTIDKPYMCNACGKGFTKKYGLKRHSRTHIDEKPYMCDVCKKCFPLKGALLRHTRIHTSNKPYSLTC